MRAGRLGDSPGRPRIYEASCARTGGAQFARGGADRHARPPENHRPAWRHVVSISEGCPWRAPPGAPAKSGLPPAGPDLWAAGHARHHWRGGLIVSASTAYKPSSSRRLPRQSRHRIHRVARDYAHGWVGSPAPPLYRSLLVTRPIASHHQSATAVWALRVEQAARARCWARAERRWPPLRSRMSPGTALEVHLGAHRPSCPAPLPTGRGMSR